MTVHFGNNRLGFYIVTLLLSGTVLGIAGNFASLFLPSLHRDFTIFALIVPSLTILFFLLSLQWAQPRTEAIELFIIGTFWLAMGAWSTDIIGFVQCDTLGGQRIPSKNDGTTSAQSYCYQMKVVQAFSWALFALFVIAFWILMRLVHQAQRYGRYHIWEEPIRELPWFGEAPGYYNTAGGYPYPYPQSPGMGPMPQPYGYPMPMQVPGQSIVIQPGVNGAPPTITQIPHSAPPV
ncbi:hypothetical protein NLJ89_g7144 [Agrocybe chaxingu]|uniref:MARVEL domain-containing protein n=1 Tax=Agrocybe chaxingu TaxID=84603 RepID=A0A9W8K525_9AGAR|nr:hypothetical protein NLJ89_g7144 [Agrocybe chaxingu]